MIQKEFIGKGGIGEISVILHTHNVKKALLVSGRESYISSGVKDSLAPLLEGLDVTQFYEFEVNPKLDDAIKGIELVKRVSPDIIIAVGGGSAIDMAKLINILACQECESFEGIITGKCNIIRRGLPLVVIPTTSGTGSEATHFAVVYIDKVKYSLAHEFVLPDYAIVDPTYTYKTPGKLVANVGMDALSQAIESFWAVKSTVESKEYAAKAISLILPNLVQAMAGDEKARDTMSKAAHIAGKAINITTTTAPHAISYPLTTYFGIPHGHAVAITLGKFFEINSNVNEYEVIDPRGKDYLSSTMEDLYKLFDCDSSKDCRNKWYGLMKNLGLEYNSVKLGLNSEVSCNVIVDNVNLERLGNNPVKVSREVIHDLFIINNNSEGCLKK